MGSFSSPCAACKYLRRKCTEECVFAPYFPPDNPRKFANIHRIFGASNVSKLLSDLSATDRDDAVRSLAYEADYRLKDPVYGCVGQISLLHQKLLTMRSMLMDAKKELAAYIGPQAMLPIVQLQGPSGMVSQHQGPSGIIPQELSQIMLPEEQHMGSPSTRMFDYRRVRRWVHRRDC